MAYWTDRLQWLSAILTTRIEEWISYMRATPSLKDDIFVAQETQTPGIVGMDPLRTAPSSAQSMVPMQSASACLPLNLPRMKSTRASNNRKLGCLVSIQAKSVKSSLVQNSQMLLKPPWVSELSAIKDTKNRTKITKSLAKLSARWTWCRSCCSKSHVLTKNHPQERKNR